MMATARIGIALRQQDAIAAHLVDSADMRPIRSDDVHVLLDLAELIALALTARTPCREFILELRPVLAAIFVVIAIERGNLTAAPNMVVAVAVVARTLAIRALVVARISLAAAFGLVVAEPRSNLIARARHETTIVKINLPPEAFNHWREGWGWVFPFGLDTGWVFYTPYSTSKSVTGVIPATMGAFILGFSSILTGLNFIASVHMLRPKGMTWFRMPLLLWGLYSTALIQILATPVLAITLLLLIAERALGIGIFDPTLGGDPILYQHFFWFYSHPAVYIMVLPALGVTSEIIGVMCRRHIFGYNFIALSSIAIAFFSFIVWGHHMFASGQSALANAIFSLLTFSVAIPSAVKVFNWVATMWKGSISLATPMLYVMQVIFVFLVGGLTGLFLGALSTDIHFHDTYFVVAHFHYVMMGTTLFALLAAMYYWYPKMFGRMYPEKLGQAAAVVVAVGFNLTFFVQFIAGAQGMPRRYATYEPQYAIYHKISTMGSWVLGLGLVMVLVSWIMGRWGKIAPPNPWGSNTLEWQTSSPPPHDNFKVTPAAGDPYALKRWRWVRSNDDAVANGWELKPEFRAKQVAAGPGHRDDPDEDRDSGGQLVGDPH